MRTCSECESDLDIDICLCAEPICLDCQVTLAHNCASSEYKQFREGLLSIWIGQNRPATKPKYDTLEEYKLSETAYAGRTLENVRR